ncbi:MAG: hypothetical protein AB1898_22525 [Acidobacteriota bacterium]
MQDGGESDQTDDEPDPVKENAPARQRPNFIGPPRRAGLVEQHRVNRVPICDRKDGAETCKANRCNDQGPPLLGQVPSANQRSHYGTWRAAMNGGPKKLKIVRFYSVRWMNAQLQQPRAKYPNCPTAQRVAAALG